MVQRLNISIPDALYERIQAQKDKLNFSKLCQEALMSAVAIEEARQMDPDEEKNMIERLRREKKEAEDEWFEIGRKVGIQDAKGMPYKHFRTIEGAHAILFYPDGDQYSAKEMVDEFLEDDWLDDLREEEGADPEIVVRGWVSGVMEIWEGVKESL